MRIPDDFFPFLCKITSPPFPSLWLVGAELVIGVFFFPGLLAGYLEPPFEQVREALFVSS